MKKCLIILISVNIALSLNAKSDKTTYLDKAEYMFQKVWNLYRVPEHRLFSEYFPNTHKPNLANFQDKTGKGAQEVSYLWLMSGVFSSVNMLMQIDKKRHKPFLDYMVTAIEDYYDAVRTSPDYQAYPVKFGKVDRYYDDNALVEIDYIDAYSLTKNKVCLSKEIEVLEFTLNGRCDDFGGGVSWLEGIRDQKPACIKGRATVLCLKLYQATNNWIFLEHSKLFYNWMMSRFEDDSLHIIMNSLITITGLPQKHYYTYNTGTMIHSTVQLYKITVEKKYLENAQRLSEGSYNFYVKKTADGVGYIRDMPWFVVMLFRGYQKLYQMDGNPKYINTIIESADYAWKNACDEGGLIYNDWTGRNDKINTQMAA